MTSRQYTDAKRRLELTHAAAAALWGITERQEYRISSGDSPVPEAIAKLLRLALAGKISRGELERA